MKLSASQKTTVGVANLIADSYNAAPISRLPDKLLEDVWLELKAIWLEPRLLNANADVTASPLYPWLVVSRVCKYWRALALSCSRLWAYIIAAQPGQAAISLDHSQQAPLTIQTARFTVPTVHHNGVSRRAMNATFKLIAEEATRIVRLHLDLNAQITRAVAACHFRGQRLCLSRLQVLYLNIDVLRTFLPGLSGIPLPRLKTLVVKGPLHSKGGNIALIQTISVESLTSLAMHRIYLSKHELFSILARPTSLQHLDLASVSVKRDSKAPSHLRVLLPHLETIHVPAIIETPLLESLVIPPLARVSLYFQMPTNPFQDFCHKLKTIESHVTQLHLKFGTCMITKSQYHFPMTKVYVDLWTEDLALENLAGCGPPPPDRSIEAELTEVWRDDVFRTCADAIRYAFAREVTTLCVGPKLIWDDLLDYNPSLRKLGVYDTEGTISLLDILLKSCMLAMLPFTLHSMVFPALEELMLDDVDWRSRCHQSPDPDFDRPTRYIRDVLRLRESQGNRLKRVLITNPSYLDSRDVEMLRSADVADAIIVLRRP